MNSDGVGQMGVGRGVTLQTNSMTPVKNKCALLLRVPACVCTPSTQHNTWLRIDWFLLLLFFILPSESQG